MKKLIKTDEGYKVEETEGFASLIDCVKAPIKPVLGEAMTPGDGFISAGTYFLVGAVVGGTVGYRYVKKAQKAYMSFKNDQADYDARSGEEERYS